MAFISVTRLRIRSMRFLPGFALHTYRSLKQVKHANGFEGGAVLFDRSWTFWTMTAWNSNESMRRYMTTGSHKIVMPRLLDWCDEAGVVHWDQPDTGLPSWNAADQRMRKDGRTSKVHNPSPQHATLNYRPPRTTVGRTIQPATSSVAG
jgi:hypothetical protein